MASTQNDRTREIVSYVLVAVGAALLAITPYWLSQGAYLRDDMQAQYMPTFMAIGRSIASGHWPYLTLQVVDGGALLGEYQYALLNPVSLLSYVAISQLDDLATAATVFVVIHYVVLGTGTYALARAFDAERRFAALAALAFVANNYVFYWFASSWIPGLVGTAWFTWAIALLIRAHRGPAWWAGSSFAIYLLLSAGWPHAVVAFVLCAAVLLVTRMREGGFSRATPAVLSLAIGGLGALSSLLPLVAMAAGAERSSAIFNLGFLQPNLSDVLAVSSPAHGGYLEQFSGFSAVQTPIFYVAWFILPFACFLRWDVLVRSRRLWMLIGATALFAALTQGPQQLSSLRWPFRFLPYMHLSLLVAFAVAATDGGVILSKRRVLGALALVGLGLAGSAQAQPVWAELALLFALLVVLLTASVLWLSAKSDSLDAAALIGGAAVVFLLTHLVWSQNLNMPDWRQPHRVGRVADLAAIPSGYGITSAAHDLPEDARPPPFGNMALTAQGASFFGYSPIGLKAAAHMFCVEVHGMTCLDGARTLFSPSVGAQTWADLMKVDTIMFFPSKISRALPNAPPGWACSRGVKFAACRRLGPRPSYPGSVGFASSGLVITGAGAASATHEALTIGPSRGGDIIFDRLAWPGYGATLDGAPLPTQQFGPGLLRVRAPPSDRPRTLVLSYEPPGLSLSLAGAMCALLLLVGGLFGWSRLGPVGLPMRAHALAGAPS